MVDPAALREALEHSERLGESGLDAPFKVILAAAWELLRRMETEHLLIVREDGEWPEWARRALGSFWGGWRDVRPMFDALAAAQRSSE